MPNPHRLPRAVIPHRYDLTLAPDLEAATFSGAVDIEVEVVEPTQEVVLNAVDLTIEGACVRVAGEEHRGVRDPRPGRRSASR